jgi:hypothetical protein
MPASAIADVCARLKEALELLHDPNDWKRTDELIDEARAVLKPIRQQSAKALAAWAALDEMGPLVSLSSSDPEWASSIAKAYLSLAIRELCSEQEQ